MRTMVTAILLILAACGYEKEPLQTEPGITATVVFEGETYEATTPAQLRAQGKSVEVEMVARGLKTDNPMDVEKIEQFHAERRARMTDDEFAESMRPVIQAQNGGLYIGPRPSLERVRAIRSNVRPVKEEAGGEDPRAENLKINLGAAAAVFGTDTRVPVNNAQFPFTTQVVVQGWDNYMCTAQMIGRWRAATAAHCAEESNGVWHGTQMIHAGWDRRFNAFARIATWTYTGFTTVMPNGWWQSNATDPYYDMMRIQWDPNAFVGLQAPGDATSWKGWWWIGDTDYDNAFLTGAGYPASPAGGVTFPWPVLFASTRSGGNWSRGDFLEHQMDTTNGHSGSGLWANYPGNGNDYFIGTHIGDRLSPGCAWTCRRNFDRRITSASWDLWYGNQTAGSPLN